MSTCSFHSTKLFHTGEGGALFCKPQYYDSMFQHHNFGHDGPEAFHGLGINAKMSELQAAMGLAVLPYMPTILAERKLVIKYYQKHLTKAPLKFLQIRPNTDWNHSYFPIIFEDEVSLSKVKHALEIEDIYPRRYFYPSLETLNYVNSTNCMVATAISKCILCLPLFIGFIREDLERIVTIIKSELC